MANSFFCFVKHPRSRATRTFPRLEFETSAREASQFWPIKHGRTKRGVPSSPFSKNYCSESDLIARSTETCLLTGGGCTNAYVCRGLCAVKIAAAADHDGGWRMEHHHAKCCTTGTVCIQPYSTVTVDLPTGALIIVKPTRRHQ